jgi:1-aminocyclopropane-1-carboxylate deaminase/D-cysteine desulfhydrase-like pyridoxal-dependent ACC family enzyme
MQTLSETPLETHYIDQVPIYVKREDLCWPFPNLSKARGVWRAIANRPGQNVAVVDTGRSLNGQLVSTIGLTLGRKVKCGYPVYVDQPDAIPGPALAIKSLGVELVPLQANRQFMMRYQMEQLIPSDWFLFPTGLRLPETVEATEEQMRSLQERSGFIGTVVVPTGTGTHLAGILRAFSGAVIAVQGYKREVARFRRDVERMARFAVNHNRLHVVQSMCDYFEVRPDRLPPFPANMHYEVRAWKWLQGAASTLIQPIVFWNIGS